MKIAASAAFGTVDFGRASSITFLALLSLLVLTSATNVQMDERSISELFAKNPKLFARYSKMIAKSHPELVSELSSKAGFRDRKISFHGDSARMLEKDRDAQVYVRRSLQSLSADQLFEDFVDEYNEDVSFLLDQDSYVAIEFVNGAALKAECEAKGLNCCVGANACDFAGRRTILLFDNSTNWNICNGTRACQGLIDGDDDLAILQNTCIGDNSCRNSFVTALPFTCIGRNACLGSDVQFIAPFSCIGRGACSGSIVADIFQFACNADETCQDVETEVIEKFTCNAKGACKGSTGEIDQFSCNALRACKGNKGTIGGFTCNAQEACLDNGLEILDGDDDCNVAFACQGP